MTDNNREELSAKDLLVAYFNIDYKYNAKGTNYWRNRCVAPAEVQRAGGRRLRRFDQCAFSSRVMKVAKKILDQGHKLNFAVANKASNQHALSEFGLEDSDEPLITIRTVRGVKYAMKDAFS